MESQNIQERLLRLRNTYQVGLMEIEALLREVGPSNPASQGKRQPLKAQRKTDYTTRIRSRIIAKRPAKPNQL